jgi:hypothetical protein
MATPVNPEGVLALRQPNFLQWAQPIAQDWLMRLALAALQSREEWLRQIQLVELECTHQLERCPFQGELDAESAECAATELLRMIENCYRSSFHILHTSDDTISLICVCRSILQALLPPGLTRWDMTCVNSDFMKELMVLSFPSVPSIKCLKADTEAFSTCSWLLLNNIQLLTDLQEFIFPTGCYRQILAELATYWQRITMLDIRSSRNVDDGSVVQLLKLKNLVYLNIVDTSITANAYVSVLSELPEVENISWTSRSKPVDVILKSIAKDRLSSVKSIMGYLRNALILIQKCQFISKLSLFCAKCDLSELQYLIALTDLTIVNSNYSVILLSAVLRGVGPRLIRLQLSGVTDVSFNTVTYHCSHLQTLEMIDCHFNISCHSSLDPQLLHFQNMEFLTLRENGIFVDFNLYLTCYVHLERFTASNIAQLDDAAVYFIVTNKGFQKLKVFSAHHCGHLTIKSAVLLIENCRNLSQIGGVGTWPDINKEVDMPYLLCTATKGNVHITEI